MYLTYLFTIDNFVKADNKRFTLRQSVLKLITLYYDNIDPSKHIHH